MISVMFSTQNSKTVILNGYLFPMLFTYDEKQKLRISTIIIFYYICRLILIGVVYPVISSINTFLEMIKKTILSLLLITFMTICSAQVNVEIQLINSGTQSFSISEAGKIYFDNGYLMVDDGNYVPFSFSISDIQKVLFSGTTSVETIENDNIRIYPNPATTFLRISSDSINDSQYQIYSIDGRLLMSGVCRQEETINISKLPKGLYLIKVDGKTFKISKS